MFIFYYKISFYDEIEEDTATVAGIVPGADIGEAMKNICSWYGGQNIFTCELEYVNQDDSIIIEIQELRKFFSDKNEDEKGEVK